MPKIIWDSGTAYDFIISLHVLHQAATFGLRPSWAAGVRQRISAPRREFLEQLYSFAGSGLEWVSSLPQPKDAADLLNQAAGLEASRRFERMFFPPELPAGVREVIHSIHSRRAASRADRDYLKTHYIRRGNSLRPTELDAMIHTCIDLDAAGEQILAALQEYHQVFFSEEEQRLRPVLERGLLHAQEQARQMSADALVEQLSHGIRLQDLAAVHTLLLAPSYWASPLVYHIRPRAHTTLIVFGVRPAMHSIVPGDPTPDLLITTLKALAEPTRLHILRYLYQEQLSQAELARRLRLRPPTVTHHLQALRLAGLIQITISANNERHYALRLERLNELGITLQEFITRQDQDE